MSWNDIDWRLIAAVLVIAGAGAVCSWQLLPEGTAAPPVEARPLMTFVCQKSGQVFVGVARPTPFANPATGEATVVPAMYCRAEKKWHPAPPPELLQTRPSAILCPKTRQPMSLDGDHPEDAIELDLPAD